MVGHYLPNTRIAVDIWEETPERKLHFLSHFHETQIIGLDSKWKKSIYTSKVTAKYLENVIKVKRKYLKVMEMNKFYTIFHKESQERFTVAVICAYHCPGSVMFLFEGSFGRILYTGHCRYKSSMLENPALAQIISEKNLDVMFLDNMYAAPECNFPTEVDCLKQVVEIIRVNPKRKILLAMSHEDEAQVLFCLVKVLKKIFVGKEKYKIIQKLVEGERRDLFTDDPSQSLIHAVGLQSVAVERDKDKSFITILLMVEYQFQDKIFEYTEESDTYIIPYSTHSSHSELVDFVSQLCPKKTVPIIVETSSKYSVIPKELQNLKKQGTVHPRKKLSLSRNHMRNNSTSREVNEEVTLKINEDKTCFSKEHPVLDLSPTSEKGDVIEGNKNDVVVCSNSSHSAACTDTNFAQKPLTSDSHELTISSSQDPNARLDVTNFGHVPLPDLDVFNGAVAIKEEVEDVEEDGATFITASPDRTELNGMIGITLHQSLTPFYQHSSQRIIKVNCGVQTERVSEASIHSVDHPVSNEGILLPSTYLLPFEVQHRMKFKLCECDSCIVNNKRRHSKMFHGPVSQFETIIDSSESEELEIPCSVLLPSEYESIIHVVDESIAKHGGQNKINLTNANTGDAGNTSVQEAEYTYSASEAVDNVLDSAVCVTSEHLCECLAKNTGTALSSASQRLKNNGLVSEYQATESNCVGGSGILQPPVSHEMSGMESNTCDKTNSCENVTLEGLKLSSQHVTVAKDVTSKTRNQDDGLCMIGRSDSSPEIFANSNYKSHQYNLNASETLIFLDYLNLQSKECGRSDTSSKNISDRHSKFNQMYQNKCTSSLLELNNSGINLCCKVVLDRLNPEHTNGYSSSGTQKEAELQQTTAGKPGGALESKLDALLFENDSKAYGSSDHRNYRKKKLATYCNRKQSTKHVSSVQETFFKPLIGSTQNLKNGSSSNETFYSAVSDFLCDSQSSSVNVSAENLQSNKIKNSNNLLLKRKWDGKCLQKTICTKLSKNGLYENHLDCDSTSAVMSTTLNTDEDMSNDQVINVVACLNGDSSSSSSSSSVSLGELHSVPKRQDRGSASKYTYFNKCGNNTNKGFSVSKIDVVSNDRGASKSYDFSTDENNDNSVHDMIKKDCENRNSRDGQKQCPGRELVVVLRSLEDIENSTAVSRCTSSVDSNTNCIKSGLSNAKTKFRKVHKKELNQLATSVDALEHSVISTSNATTFGKELRDEHSVLERVNLKRSPRVLSKKSLKTGVSANKNKCSKEQEGRNTSRISTTNSKHNINNTGNGLVHDGKSSNSDDCVIIKDMRDRRISNNFCSKLRSRTKCSSTYKVSRTKDLHVGVQNMFGDPSSGNDSSDTDLVFTDSHSHTRQKTNGRYKYKRKSGNVTGAF